jgi:hypothetical protein
MAGGQQLNQRGFRSRRDLKSAAKSDSRKIRQPNGMPDEVVSEAGLIGHLKS